MMRAPLWHARARRGRRGRWPRHRRSVRSRFRVKAGITVAPDIGQDRRSVPHHGRHSRAARARRSNFRAPPIRRPPCSRSIPSSVRTSADTTAAEQYADYRVAAWDIGAQADPTARRDRSLQRRRAAHSAAAPRCSCRACSRQDTAQRVPKAAAPAVRVQSIPVVVDRAAHRGGDRARLADLVVVPAAAQERRSRWPSIRSRTRRLNSSASKRSVCSTPVSAAATSR